MFMVCVSNDSRTPRRRPSLIGRMPTLGNPLSHQIVLFIIFPPFSHLEWLQGSALFAKNQPRTRNWQETKSCVFSFLLLPQDHQRPRTVTYHSQLTRASEVRCVFVL